MNRPAGMEIPEYAVAELAAMTPVVLVELLVRDEDRVPRAAIDECARRGDAMLDRLEPAVTDADAWADDGPLGEWWLRFHAAMILGQIPSARAGQLLAELLRQIAVADDDSLQDWLAGYWPALFRNKPGAVRPAVRAVAEDRTLDWYYRSGAVEAALAMANERSAQALEDELDWAAAIASAEDEDWDLRLMTGTTLLDYPRERHRALLEALALRQSPTNLTFGADEIERAFTPPGEPREVDRFRDPWAFYSAEAIAARQRRWAEEDAATDPDAAHASDVEPPDDVVWHRLGELVDAHRLAMLRFVRKAYDGRVFDEATRVFTGDPRASFDPEDAALELFIPWMCNFWSPSRGQTRVLDKSLHGVPPTAAYLARTKRVDPLLRSYLESCLASPLTVFQIVQVRPGRGFRLRDLFTNAEHDVAERSASRTMRRADLIVGQLGAAGGVTMLEATQRFVIAAEHAPAALQWRARAFPDGQPVTAAELRARHADVVGLYREIEGWVIDGGLPQLQNTDGDAISLRRVVFDISSAQDAFDSLKHLALGESDAELLHDAERDASGALLRAQFPWLKEGVGHAGVGHTLLGSMSVHDRRLFVQVNSEARETRIRSIIADTLGDRAIYRMTEMISMEQAMSEGAQ
jgi:hypothetical protein